MPDIFWEVWMPNFGSEKITFFRFFMIRSSNLEISKSSGQYTYEISKFPARFQKFQKYLEISKNQNFGFEKNMKKTFFRKIFSFHKNHTSAVQPT